VTWLENHPGWAIVLVVLAGNLLVLGGFILIGHWT
jgi:hypothetical protein